MSENQEFSPVQQIVVGVVTIVVATIVLSALRNAAIRSLVKYGTKSK